MLHSCPRIPGQSFDELSFEEEILDFLRDDFMFSTVKVVSRHQNTQQYGALLPIELTNEEIRNTKAYKDYYTYATREATPKPKASARRKRSGSDSSITPPTAVATPRSTIVAAPKLTNAAKGKQPAKATKAKSLFALSEPGGLGTDKGTGSKPEVLDVPTDDSKEDLSWNSSDDEGTDTHEKDRDDDEGDEGDESDNGEEDDAEDKDGKEKDDDDDDQEIANSDEQDDTERGGDDNEKSKSDEESDDEETRDEESFDPILRTFKESEDDGNDEEEHGLKIGKEERLTKEEEADELYRDVDINQGREYKYLKKLKTLTMLNPISDVGVESIFVTTSTSMPSIPTPKPTVTPSIIATTTKSSQAPIPPTTFPSEILQHLPSFGLLFCFDERLKALEENFSEFSQTHPFAEAVFAIPDRAEENSYQKMEVNKSIQRFDEQRNLYKVLVEAYEADKIILNTYRDRVILKRRRDDEDDQGEGPSAGSDRGSKRQREEEPVQTTSQIEEPSHMVFETGAEDQPIVQSSQHPEWFSQPKKPPTLDRRHVIPFEHFINNDLEYLRGGASSRKYTTSVTKTKAADYGHIKWIKDLVPRTMWIHEPIDYGKHALWGVSHWGRKRQQFYSFGVNQESTRDVYSKRRIIVVTDLKIVEWHSYKHLDWISDVYKEYCHPATCGRSLTGSRKLPEEAQPYQARHVPVQPKTKGSVYCLFKPTRIHLSKQGQENRLMRIDELYKFSDGMLNDVRTALDDHLKGIRMQYLPHTIWRKGDKDKAAVMIQAIDKMLKTRRIMRSLEKFVGGRLAYTTTFAIFPGDNSWESRATCRRG
nr:hypothetical protein [Tanacetum cinerariifolium]